MIEKNPSYTVFLSGSTGYMGRRLIPLLLERGHTVRGLARPSSAGKLPPGCTVILGDALQSASYASKIAPADTFIHLVGVSHPSPWKEDEFRAVDLASIKEAISASRDSGIRQFIYVSVAHPAPIMKAYINVRVECEELIRSAGLNATILRPWYVLGPGHRWPYILIPAYWLLERYPGTREGARRLGLVSLEEMLRALWSAVETPERGLWIYEVPKIRDLASEKQRPTASKV